MAVIPKHQIKKFAKKYNVLGANYNKDYLQPSSYDLRIGTIFKEGKIYSPHQPENNKPYIEVKPSEIVTMLTLEEVKIPNFLVGTVFAINRMSSQGLLILNPGHIDPGFEGPISICAINLSSKTIKLQLGDPIFTLILTTLSEPVLEEDLYKKQSNYPNRREYEAGYLRRSFSNLSNSIFDLVVEFDKSKVWLVNRVFQYMIVQLIKWLPIIAAIIAIVGTVRYCNPNPELKLENEKLQFEKDSLERLYILEQGEKNSIYFRHKKDTLQNENQRK